MAAMHALLFTKTAEVVNSARHHPFGRKSDIQLRLCSASLSVRAACRDIMNIGVNLFQQKTCFMFDPVVPLS